MNKVEIKVKKNKNFNNLKKLKYTKIGRKIIQAKNEKYPSLHTLELRIYDISSWSSKWFRICDPSNIDFLSLLSPLISVILVDNA